jgi:hypothetical protein
LSFLDTLAYPAFIDTLWRLPRSPDQAMYNPWQGARVVHDVAAIQEVGVAKLLAGEPVQLGVGLPVLDVVASDDYVELVLQPQDAEHAPGPSL